MKLAPIWVRTLAMALLCLMALSPTVLHARVCLVELGALPESGCCARMSCCLEESSAEPRYSGDATGCGCCVNVDLESGERIPIVGPNTISQDATLPPASPIFVLPALPEPPAGEVARALFARAGPPPRPPAALVPLRI